VRRADKLTTFMCRLSWNLGASASWNPQGLSRLLTRLLYLYYTVKLNGSLVSVCNNAKGYQDYANMKHNFVSLLARQKISSNLGVRTGIILRIGKSPSWYLLFLMLQNSQTMLRTKWRSHFPEINMTANKKTVSNKIKFQEWSKW